MSDVEIRPAQPADLTVLTSTFGDDDFFADRLARQHAGRGVLLTAWLLGKPVGDVYLWLESAEETEIRANLPGVPLLMHVEIHPDYRNRGLGTEMVYGAERLLLEKGFDRVALAVHIENFDAYRLYARLGYRVWPHPPVECAYERRRPDGTREHGTETCYMLVKKLAGDSSPGRDRRY